MVNLFYFNKLWTLFSGIDKDHDRRITLAEFQAALKLLGVNMPPAEARAEFAGIDSNEGGMVLFDGLLLFIASVIAHVFISLWQNFARGGRGDRCLGMTLMTREHTMPLVPLERLRCRRGK
jgi:hypothetical protein